MLFKIKQGTGMFKRLCVCLCAASLLVLGAEALSQNNAVVLPSDDGFQVVPIPASPATPSNIEEAIGKEIRWTKGPDVDVAAPPALDPDVVISFQGNTGFSEDGLLWERSIINFGANEIRHWGEQQVFDAPVEIFAASVLMVDRGDYVEGGRFEWVGNNQCFVLWNNVVRTNRPDVPWIRNWTDPREGDKVYFFIMSPDERLASNPIEFIWPGSESLEGAHD